VFTKQGKEGERLRRDVPAPGQDCRAQYTLCVKSKREKVSKRYKPKALIYATRQGTELRAKPEYQVRATEVEPTSPEKRIGVQRRPVASCRATSCAKGGREHKLSIPRSRERVLSPVKETWEKVAPHQKWGKFVIHSPQTQARVTPPNGSERKKIVPRGPWSFGTCSSNRGASNEETRSPAGARRLRRSHNTRKATTVTELHRLSFCRKGGGDTKNAPDTARSKGKSPQSTGTCVGETLSESRGNTKKVVKCQ